MHSVDLTSSRHSRFLPDEAATLEFGSLLAAAVQPGLVIYLRGDLGAGKTTLVRGLLGTLGHPGRVKSPTFTLVEVYKISKLYFYHFDFYRFDEPEDWVDAGFREYFNSESVCIVEWPEKAPTLPQADIYIELRVSGEGRVVEWHAATEVGRTCLGRVH